MIVETHHVSRVLLCWEQITLWILATSHLNTIVVATSGNTMRDDVPNTA